MTISKCKHGIYLDGCRECFPIDYSKIPDWIPMNAYELADELWACFTKADFEYIDEAVNMLRQQADSLRELWVLLDGRKDLINQQADRIAELEGEVSHLKHINKNWSISEGWALQRVAELEKQLKPVGNGTIGYLDDIPINDLVHRKSLPLPLPKNIWTACGACGQRVTGDSIHTCSPQTKPLTEEEVIDICALCDIDWSEAKGLYVRHSNGSWIGLNERIGKLVRAIEAKVRGQ
jgi:hypothetical protein